LLKEFEFEFGMIKEEYWLRRNEFIQMSPASNLPVIKIPDSELILVGIYPIVEYMNDTHENFYFMPASPEEKSGVRKYLSWFNDKFYREVTKILIDEKMIRLLMRKGAPRTNFLKAAKDNLNHHMKFLSSCLENNTYLVSEKLSCADIAAAAHISVVDYFGEITWDMWPKVKHWYSIIKSRPAFRPLLLDHMPGFTPPKAYADLDF
jgi:glutathione S-transferase